MNSKKKNIFTYKTMGFMGRRRTMGKILSEEKAKGLKQKMYGELT